MTAVAKKPKRRRARLIYLTVHKVILPETGELIGALIPSTKWDRRTMKERKFHTGIELQGDLRQARNVKFYRLAHALGGFLADHVEGFEGLSQHEALKRLQEQSGIGCEEESFSMDLGPALGTVTGTRKVAESLNFEDMDELRWSELWGGTNGEGGWIGWLRREKFGALHEDLRIEVEMMITKEDQ